MAQDGSTFCSPMCFALFGPYFNLSFHFFYINLLREGSPGVVDTSGFINEGCPGKVREDMCSRLVKTMQQVSSEMAEAEATLVENIGTLGIAGIF